MVEKKDETLKENKKDQSGSLPDMQWQSIPEIEKPPFFRSVRLI